MECSALVFVLARDRYSSAGMSTWSFNLEEHMVSCIFVRLD